jgi:hypothetical protein
VVTGSGASSRNRVCSLVSSYEKQKSKITRFESPYDDGIERTLLGHGPGCGWFEGKESDAIALNDECSLLPVDFTVWKNPGVVLIIYFKKFARINVECYNRFNIFVALHHCLDKPVVDILKDFSELKRDSSVNKDVTQLESTVKKNDKNIIVSNNICKSFDLLRVYIH